MLLPRGSSWLAFFVTPTVAVPGGMWSPRFINPVSLPGHAFLSRIFLSRTLIGPALPPAISPAYAIRRVTWVRSHALAFFCRDGKRQTRNVLPYLLPGTSPPESPSTPPPKTLLYDQCIGWRAAGLRGRGVMATIV